MTTWLLDTNVLIQACPGFRDWLDAAAEQGKVFSLDSVSLELTDGDDLAAWAKSRTNFFLPLIPEDAPSIPACPPSGTYSRSFYLADPLFRVVSTLLKGGSEDYHL